MAAFLLPLAIGVAPQTHGADEAALLKDFTSVAKVLGLPCGAVVAAKRQADKDHLVSCENGNRYRIYVNKENRVVAQKQ